MRDAGLRVVASCCKQQQQQQQQKKEVTAFSPFSSVLSANAHANTVTRNPLQRESLAKGLQRTEHRQLIGKLDPIEREAIISKVLPLLPAWALERRPTRSGGRRAAILVGRGRNHFHSRLEPLSCSIILGNGEGMATARKKKESLCGLLFVVSVLSGRFQCVCGCVFL